MPLFTLSPRSGESSWCWLHRATQSGARILMIVVIVAVGGLVIAPAAVLADATPTPLDTSGPMRIASSHAMTPAQLRSPLVTDQGAASWVKAAPLKPAAMATFDRAKRAQAAVVVAPTPPTYGDTIAAVALGFQGYPYVWAGNSPAGFDCSGFTQYVVLASVGVDIGHAVEGQPGVGAWIDWGTWMPGDLVFFQNTYRAGISHVGIYIGDGLFIHAENEGTGVVITSIYSDYYGARYWGAVRVA
jgi:cell wall-associated NlpC family hydrolase